MKKSKEDPRLENLTSMRQINQIKEDINHPPRKQIIRTHENYKIGQFPKDYEANNEPSLTTPGMAENLRTIIERYTTGREVPLQSNPYYLDGLPDPNDMEPIERELYKRQVYQQVQEKQKEIIDLTKQAQQQQIKDLQDKLDQQAINPQSDKPLPAE